MSGKSLHGNHRPYLGRSHPVASVAARNCAAHLGKLHRHQLGETACGACWERAIRDDERAVVEFGLPREVVPDLSYVDEIAVELACRGEQVALTRVERVVVAERLRLQAARAAELEARRTVTVTEARRMSRSSVDWKGRPQTPKTAADLLDGRVA
jgi:hypothetical protein